MKEIEAAAPLYDGKEVEKIYARLSLSGVVLAIVGAAMELQLGGGVRSQLWTPAELGGAVMKLEPSAVTTIGIWVLIAGPIMGMLAMLKRGVERRSGSAVFLSGGVLTVIALSIPVKVWLQGTF